MEIKHKIKYYINNGSLNKAKKICAKILEKDPLDIEILEALGYIFFNEDSYEESLSIYKKLHSQKRGNINYLEAIAKCNNELKNYKESILSYEKIVLIDNKNENALAMLGKLYLENSNYQLAIKSFVKLINNNPENFVASLYFSQLMINSYDVIEEKDYPLVEKTINNLYTNNRIAFENLEKISQKILFSKLFKEKLLNDDKGITVNDILILNNQLFYNSLRKNLITNIEVEKFLTKTRKFLLKKIINRKLKNIDQGLEKALISIAIQCFYNEYIWYYDQEEEELIQTLEEEIKNKSLISDNKIKFYLYILFSYKNNVSSEVRLIISELKDVINNDFYKIFIHNIEIENINKDKILSIGKIKNKVSKEISSQYEENPYPRWQSIADINEKEFDKVINTSIFPNNIKILNNQKALDVLVAGCGTGKVAIAAAKLYKNSHIYAFDLSKNSLAYAKRLSDEYRVNNINFYQADILEIKKIKKNFDIIECTGVLHHMNDPLEGLRALLSVLKDDGYLRISLYSTMARSLVRKLRIKIKNENIGLNKKEIINFREKMKVQFKKSNILSSDFYSLSGFRDLFFNLKEHTFLQKEIKDILDKHNLDFLGYYFRDPEIKKKFINTFNDDPKCINLDYWDIFEKNNLHTFSETPSFWCKKNNI
ncbi:MAG: hypothetical protein CMH01_01020 [Marinovum sp.]|nr:hypothetical protein [Marinovum sp.]